MINILFLQPSLPVGGAERVLFDLVTHMDRSKFRPVVACMYDKGEIGRRLADLGLPVHDRLFNSRFDPQGLASLLSLSRQERIHLLYTHEHPATIVWGGAVAKLAGLKASIMAVHSTGDRAQRKRRLASRMVPSDIVIALSEAHRDYLADLESYPKKKIRVVPNGIDPSPYMSANPGTRWPDAVPHGVPIVGIVAMLRSEKAHGTLLRAAAEIQDRTPAHFVIVGDGPEDLSVMKDTQNG